MNSVDGMLPIYAAYSAVKERTVLPSIGTINGNLVACITNNQMWGSVLSKNTGTCTTLVSH